MSTTKHFASQADLEEKKVILKDKKIKLRERRVELTTTSEENQNVDHEDG